MHDFFVQRARRLVVQQLQKVPADGIRARFEIDLHTVV